MIYPDVTIKEWIKIYPALEVKVGLCLGTLTDGGKSCGQRIRTNRPFIEKHWAGLESHDCPRCGRPGKLQKCVFTPRSKELEGKLKLFMDQV